MADGTMVGRYPATGTIPYSEAMIRWAAINGMLCRLARGRPASRQARRTFDWPS
jgi:hypothetical protein